jgi:hypothetical protein
LDAKVTLSAVVSELIVTEGEINEKKEKLKLFESEEKS